MGRCCKKLKAVFIQKTNHTFYSLLPFSILQQAALAPCMVGIHQAMSRWAQQLLQGEEELQWGSLHGEISKQSGFLVNKPGSFLLQMSLLTYHGAQS